MGPPIPSGSSKYTPSTVLPAFLTAWQEMAGSVVFSSSLTPNRKVAVEEEMWLPLEHPELEPPISPFGYLMGGIKGGIKAEIKADIKGGD